MTSICASRFALAVAWLAIATPAAARQSAPTPASELAGLVRAYLAMDHPIAWEGLDALPGVQWAAPAPTSLQNCLPDGGCYARQGAVALGAAKAAVMATGARTMATTLYLRNAGTAVGVEAVLAALTAVELTAELARCPIRGGPGTTSWYRIKGGGSPGVLAIQTVRGARPSEGFVLTAGEELPALQPNQLAAYSEQCAPGAAQRAVATLKPHERLAEIVVALLVPAASPGLDWAGLTALPLDATWSEGEPRPTNLSFRNDPSPMALTGSATWSGRKFSLLAAGSATQVKTIYLEELGLHPRGEHLLGVVHAKGVAVRLVRCGPVYTESTNNWYSLQSPRTRPAMVRQSIRYDGNSVQDEYALRLDGTLPVRDPRDREPGAGGCQ